VAECVEARRTVRRAFDRAAASYDTAAGVQREICARLAALIDTHPPREVPRRLADAGCGTGYGLEVLRQHFPEAARLAIDFAPAMLHTSARNGGIWPLCADLQALPLAARSLDALWSSLALQWCDAQTALDEFARVLKPGGMAWIATLGPDTLCELRDAFAAVDDEEHVLRFRPSGEWAEMARKAGFEVLLERREQTCVLAMELRGVIAHLKGIGAHRIGAAPRRALRRSEWNVLEHAYERHRRSDGLLPANYDVILLALRRG
jgi:malonyl-CoA O-methyltransferase